jgi:hypothetical protein
MCRWLPQLWATMFSWWSLQFFLGWEFKGRLRNQSFFHSTLTYSHVANIDCLVTALLHAVGNSVKCCRRQNRLTVMQSGLEGQFKEWFSGWLTAFRRCPLSLLWKAREQSGVWLNMVCFINCIWQLCGSGISLAKNPTDPHTFWKRSLCEELALVVLRCKSLKKSLLKDWLSLF